MNCPCVYLLFMKLFTKHGGLDIVLLIMIIIINKELVI